MEDTEDTGDLRRGQGRRKRRRRTGETEGGGKFSVEGENGDCISAPPGRRGREMYVGGATTARCVCVCVCVCVCEFCCFDQHRPR